jgi:hypothetical protein
MHTHQRKKMPGIIIYLSILSLYVNGLNSPIKLHRLSGGLKSNTDNLLPKINASHWQKQASSCSFVVYACNPSYSGGRDNEDCDWSQVRQIV